MISVSASWFGELAARFRALRLPGLRLTMLVSFGSLFALAIVGLQWAESRGVPLLGFQGDAREVRAEVFRSLSLTADLKKERLLGWLEGRRDDVHVLAESELVRRSVAALLSSADERLDGFPGAEGGPDLRLLLQHLRLVHVSYGVYEAIEVVDAATGEVVVSTAQGVLDAPAPARSVQDAIEHPWETSMALVQEAEAESPRLRIARVIRAPDAPDGRPGEVVAVLTALVNLDDMLLPMLHTGGGLGKTGEALLIDQDVKIIASLKFPLADGSTAQPLEYEIAAMPAVLAAAQQEGLISTTDYRGEQVLAAYRYIPLTAATGWGMVVKRDQAEVFASLQQRQTQSLVLGAGVLLVVLAVAYLVASAVSRPIRDLSETAKQVAGGDLGARAPETGTSETRLFATTFNSMVEAVGQRTRELETVNEELKAFSYSVSHDLRAPLRAIDGFSLAVVEDYADQLDEEGQRLLGRVRRASQRMGNLIDDLLKLSRVSAVEMERVDLDLSALATAIIRELRQRDPEREVEVRVERGLRASGDRLLVRSVLTNLLDNAWKFTRHAPHARIEFGRVEASSETVFRVRDNGVGFDMDYVGKLFEPFQRLHSVEEFEGTGIGLATVRRIVRRHGGEAWAEAAEGEGASLFFTLPEEDNG